MALEKGLVASDGTAKDEGMDIVGAFIGVDSLQVHHMPDDVIFIRDAVATQHLTRHPSDLDRLHA